MNSCPLGAASGTLSRRKCLQPPSPGRRARAGSGAAGRAGAAERVGASARVPGAARAPGSARRPPAAAAGTRAHEGKGRPRPAPGTTSPPSAAGTAGPPRGAAEAEDPGRRIPGRPQPEGTSRDRAVLGDLECGLQRRRARSGQVSRGLKRSPETDTHFI